MELHEKTIIITGASGGIGAAAARLFAREGANLVLGARRVAELSALAEEIRDDGGQAIHMAGDVTDPLFSTALVDLAESTFGSLDGAFNNAGVMGDMISVPEMSLENWQDVLNTNLTGAFLSVRAQTAALQRGKGGAVVFTSSFVGHSNGGMPGMAAYAASKAGMIGMMKSLACDHAAEGIRINAVLPGGTLTDMAGTDPDVHAFISDLHPVKRMAAPEEIAQSALFLLSDRASFVTGAALLADGGISVRLT